MMDIQVSHIIDIPFETNNNIFPTPSNFKPSSSSSNKTKVEYVDPVDHEPSTYESRHDINTISNECIQYTLTNKITLKRNGYKFDPMSLKMQSFFNQISKSQVIKYEINFFDGPLMKNYVSNSNMTPNILPTKHESHVRSICHLQGWLHWHFDFT